MLLLIALSACSAPPPANPEFSDAAIYALQEMRSEDPANLAFAMRQLEAQMYTTLDVESSKVTDRSVTPEQLSASDVEGYDVPTGEDPADCLPVMVVRTSPYDVDDHVVVQMLADQTPIEPSSPDKYDRMITEGADCFADHDCDALITENDLIKDNALLYIEYVLWKDFRWVDLNLPDPADVPEGEPVVNDGEPRWALAGTSWISEPAAGDGATITQSYSLEVWIPRDGGGYLGDGADSDGEGLLRMMALWSDTELDGFDFDDDTIAATTRSGIEGIFEAADDWLEDN